MTNVVRIPDHVLLPEDEIHKTIKCTDSEDSHLDREIEVLEQKIIIVSAVFALFNNVILSEFCLEFCLLISSYV